MYVGIYQTLALAAVVAAYYVIDIHFLNRFDPQRRDGRTGRGWLYTTAVLPAIVLVLLQPLALPRLGWRTQALWGVMAQSLGLPFAAGGLVLHSWARHHLGKFYAERPEVQPDHVLISSGPYAFVRHPIFISYFLCALGFALINPSLTTLLLAAYVIWDYPGAARREEDLLSRNLSGYADYMARTPRFFPRLAGYFQ